MYLEAVGGLGDLTQHGSHCGAEPCPDDHGQHFILRAAFIPHLHQPHMRAAEPQMSHRQATRKPQMSQDELQMSRWIMDKPK